MFKSCVSACATTLKCDSMTQDKAHHVVSNNKGARELSLLSVLNLEHMRCIGQRKEALTKAKRGTTKGIRPCLVRAACLEVASRLQHQLLI